VRQSILSMLLVALLLAGWPLPALPKSSGPAPAAVKAAFTRAMSWVQDHPASLQAGGSLEIAEEVYMFDILYNTARDAAARQGYRKQIADRYAAMSPDLESNMETRRYLFDPAAPTNYAIIAEMFARVDLPISDYRRIIGDMQLFHWNFLSDYPSSRMVLALYLDRLGIASPVPVEPSIEQSRLYRDPTTHALLQRLNGGSQTPGEVDETEHELYDLTHETLALVDFGALPAPDFVCRQAPYFRRLFDAGMDWAIRHRSLDVMAELAVCAKLLGLGDDSGVDEALATLIQRQAADGSFGPARLVRENVYRHPVLTGATALGVSSCDNACGSPCRP
jgi:Domain of unknown function (DUF6895)